MEDLKKPNELEEFNQFMGNTEEKMFQSLFPEMEEQEKSYLDIKNPSSRQPPGAQCGVMRAAATHTTTKPSSREQFCSAGCRQQTAVRRGQSVGQLRHHEEEENLEKDLKNFPIVITRSGLGNSRHQDPRSWTSRPRSVGDVVCAIVSYFVFIEFKLCMK